MSALYLPILTMPIALRGAIVDGWLVRTTLAPLFIFQHVRGRSMHTYRISVQGSEGMHTFNLRANSKRAAHMAARIKYALYYGTVWYVVKREEV